MLCKRSHCREKPAHRKEESSPLAPTRESLHKGPIIAKKNTTPSNFWQTTANNLLPRFFLSAPSNPPLNDNVQRGIRAWWNLRNFHTSTPHRLALSTLILSTLSFLSGPVSFRALIRMFNNFLYFLNCLPHYSSTHGINNHWMLHHTSEKHSLFGRRFSIEQSKALFSQRVSSPWERHMTNN